MSEQDYQLKLPLCPAQSCGRLIGGLAPSRNYARPQPEVLGPVEGWLIDARKAHEQVATVVPPSCHLYEFDDGLLADGVVITSDYKIVAESLINRDGQKSFAGLLRGEDGGFSGSREHFSQIRHHFPKAILLKQAWDNNYGHWLIEGLPRIVPLLSLLAVEKIPILISAGPEAIQRVYRDSLRVFGIEEELLIPVGTEVIKVDTLYYPTPLTRQPWEKAPVVIDILERLRDRLAPQVGEETPAPKKILISRPETSRRNLENYAEIRPLFLDRDFVEVCPAKMTFSQQVKAFSQASHVAGVLGAECVNIAFSPRGLRYLGFAPSQMQDDFFWDLTALKFGYYVSLHGLSTDRHLHMNSSFSVDPALLREILAKFDA